MYQLQAQIFQFHLTEVYKYESCSTYNNNIEIKLKFSFNAFYYNKKFRVYYTVESMMYVQLKSNNKYKKYRLAQGDSVLALSV